MCDNAVGTAVKSASLGTLGNSLSGLVGGGLVGKLIGILLPALGAAAANKGGLDIVEIIKQLIGGGVGGGALTLIIGLIKSMMSK